MNIDKVLVKEGNDAGTKQPKQRVLKKLGCFFLLLFLAIGVYVLLPLPSSEDSVSGFPSSFRVVSENNYFEDQPPGQCAAYASAFVSRHFGEDIKGDQVYEELEFKIPVSGYVLPKGLIKHMESRGFSPGIFRGKGTEALKSSLYTTGNPVIVIIGDGLRWQHYMTLTGYDTKQGELYFYDSKKTTDENNSLPGNRTVAEEYFMSLWNNGLPVFNRVYITFQPKKE